MLVKILGIADIISALAFWLFAFFHILPEGIIYFLAFYLLIKGVVFLISADIASILDVICSVIFFLALSFNVPGIIIIIVAFFLLQKGIFSIIA